MTERNKRLKKAMKDKKVSQEKLGQFLGVTGQAVSDRLSSDQDVDSIEFISAVSELTGEDFYELMNGKPSTVDESIPDYQKGLVKRVPFYDIEATGGMNGGDVSP